MSWDRVIFWTLLIAGALLVWLGSHRAQRNRRRHGVLPAPSSACRRNGVESVT